MRAPLGLGRRYRAIFSYTGLILSMAGLWTLTPLALLPAWPEEVGQLWAFLLPGGLLLTAGGLAWRVLRSPDVALTVQEGGVIVVLSWVMVCLASAWPLIMAQGLDFTHAVFEAVSGWTTTGLSIVDVTRASHLTLYWRSAMQLAGGAGLAILMLAALTGPPGSGLSVAEGRSEQLVPHVRQSAKLVVLIYAGYAVAGVAALRAVGMDLFDAVNHAYGAVSTGGFSTVPESIGHWNSPPIEAVTLALMVLGNLNFLTAYVLFRGRLRAFWRNGEVRLQAILYPIAAAAAFAFVCRGLYPTLGKQLRVAAFETVSALTTTGFSTVGYGDWNGFGIFILVVLMLVGGGTCSTAGGIKQYRIYLLFESLAWELRRPFLPQRAVVEPLYWQGERRVFLGDSQVRQITAFVTLYLLAFAVGTAILTAAGYGLRESLFEFASALGTVGLSVGVTAPNAPRLVLWTETIGMFLGRLEFFVIFVGSAKLLQDLTALARGVVGRRRAVRPCRGSR